jgi:ABC-type transport system substrate-binding protein
VTHIDAGTGDQMTDPIRVGSGPRGIVRVGDDVWVADELSLSVTRIDVRTRRPHTIDVGDGPTSIAVLGGWLWVAERYSGSLTRIDLATEKQNKIAIGAPVRGVTVAAGRLWVASGAFASSHLGGTLVVATDNFPAKDSPALDGIDPARVYDVWAHPPIRVVYDGLVAYHYSGLDAQVLVPDLATTVPEPTDGGRTYIFNLRRGIRYSTGAEVKASDFVRGVQRALLLGPRHDFYRAIVGGRACKHGRTFCDLSNGVVADDLAGRVTFHLVAPDPQFLYKLVQLVVPTPEGTPLAPLTSPLPGTGPYRIATYEKNKTYSLDRNPFFQQWSAPAQPAGFLDAITWVKVDTEMEAVEAVRQGRADLAELPGSEVDMDQLIHDLKVSSPNHVHGDLTSLTGFTILNSAIPPFDDVRARRAFNYAVDRNKIVHMTAGPSVIKPTCQLMPPTMPSYVRYCPYTTGAPGGAYQGPDLAKARELVRASGTKGMKVTVTDVVNDWNGPPELDEYLTDVLRSIGYDAYHRLLPKNPRSKDYFYDPESPIQVESGVFIADFPLPSNMYEIVACAGTAYPAPLNYCNKDLDARAAAATAKLESEPGAALREWTQIDRELTDQAPLVPISNLVDWWVTSERVGNYQNGAQDYGPLLSQLWVQ